MCVISIHIIVNMLTIPGTRQERKIMDNSKEIEEKRRVFQVGFFVKAYRYSLKVGWNYGKIIQVDDTEVTVQFFDDVTLIDSYPYSIIGTKEDKENLNSFIEVVSKAEVIKYLYPIGSVVMVNFNQADIENGWAIARVSRHEDDGLRIDRSGHASMLVKYESFNGDGNIKFIRKSFRSKKQRNTKKRGT